MKPAILDNEAVYPRGEKMHSLTPSLPLPTEILLPQNRLWTQLKAGR
jgi:putrescine transport system substrate-binding protein